VMAIEESDERCGWPRTPLASCRTYRLRTPFQLVHLYAERGSPKYEKAARRWLVRYLTEGTPTLKDVSKVTASSRFGLASSAPSHPLADRAPAGACSAGTT
jgi:hypothetical protein